MKCPYCKQDLVKGHIQTRGEVLKWLPYDRQISRFELRWKVRDEDIRLGDYKFWHGVDVDAYCCPNCHKIIIDYK